MPIFSADQIIGKALIAKSPVKIVRFAQDNAHAVFTVPSGNPIGTVEAYLLPGAGRSSLYWQFLDSNSRSYFVAHKPGLFDIDTLSNQGALTLEEEKKAEEEKNLSTTDKVIKAGTNILLLVAGFGLLLNFLRKK